jgi:hypothetical protein
MSTANGTKDGSCGRDAPGVIRKTSDSSKKGSNVTSATVDARTTMLNSRRTNYEQNARGRQAGASSVSSEEGNGGQV